MSNDDYNEWLREMWRLDREIEQREQENQNAIADDAKYVADYVASITEPPLYRRLYGGFLRLLREEPLRGAEVRPQSFAWPRPSTKGHFQAEQEGHTDPDDTPPAA